jgi:hypothetical protein
MPKQSPTEVKLEYICREIKELKEEQKQLRADINKGKGAIWLLIAISGIIAAGLYLILKTKYLTYIALQHICTHMIPYNNEEMEWLSYV